MEPSTPTGCSCRTANIGDIQPNTNIRPFMDNDVTIATFTSTTECSSNNFTFVQTEGANIATDITASKTPYGHYAVKAAIITPRSEKIEIRINNTKCEEFTITQEAGSSSLCYCEEISIPIIEFEWDNMDADTVMINDPSNCIESLSQPVDDTEHFWITATTEYISIEPKDKNTGTADYIDSCFVYFKLNGDSLCVKQFTAIQKGTDAPTPTTECVVSNIVNGNPLPAISSAGVVICEFDGNINCSPENFTLIHIYGTEILSHSEGSSIITGVSISKVENHFKIYATSYSRNDGQERTEGIAIYINNVGLGGHFKITQNGAQP